MNEPCSNFCTANCVNGNCPIAFMEEREERGMPVIVKCDECSYHTSCSDCDFNRTEMCGKHIKDSTELSGGSQW